MNSFFAFLSLTAICSSVVPIWRARRAVRNTTLAAAWRWATAGICAWLTVVVAEIFAGESVRGLLSVAWYAVALLLLCPAIAVLGAQRPVVRVWSWFVILPFGLVFSWPAAASYSELLHNRPFVLETPMAVGYALVAVMGLGNYLGTRYSLPALLTAVSLLLLVLPLAASDFSWLPEALHCRIAATLSIAIAVWWADRLARQSYSVRTALDRVWIEFRDCYGIVWSKRILDRLNQMAAHDDLPVRMGINGVVSQPDPNTPPEAEAVAALEKSLRWLLRRFVDETWFDARLLGGHDESSQP